MAARGNVYDLEAGLQRRGFLERKPQSRVGDNGPAVIADTVDRAARLIPHVFDGKGDDDVSVGRLENVLRPGHWRDG